MYSNLTWQSPIEMYGGLQYPLISLNRIFPNLKKAGENIDLDGWHPALGYISYRNIMKMFTYHDRFQS